MDNNIITGIPEENKISENDKEELTEKASEITNEKESIFDNNKELKDILSKENKNEESKENKNEESKENKPKDVDEFEELLDKIHNTQGIFMNRIKITDLELDIGGLFKEYMASGIKNTLLDHEIHDLFKPYGK